MTEQLYDLVVFSDGDARVYRHGRWGKEGVTEQVGGQHFEFSVAQTSPDKELLIKIANMARSDYLAKFVRLDEPQYEAVCKSVDQTLERVAL